MKKYIFRHTVNILEDFNKIRLKKPFSLDTYIKKYFKSHKSGKFKKLEKLKKNKFLKM